MKRVLFSIGLCLFLVSSLKADPIVVSGVITAGGGVVGSLGLGTVATLSGVNFSANVRATGGNFETGLGQCDTLPCTVAGTSFLFGGSDAAGTFTLDGITYNADVINQIQLAVTGPLFSIPIELMNASVIQVTAPFSFSGIVSPVGDSATLVGEGTVVIFLVRSSVPDLPPGFFFDHATYTLGPVATGVSVQAVPEPTGLLLLVSGLAGIGYKFIEGVKRLKP